MFDLCAGTSYERAMDMKMIDPDTVEFKGSAYQILPMYEKIMRCNAYKVECSMKPEELIPSFVTDPIDRFIREKGTNIIKDLSEYTVQFHRIG